MDIQLSKGENVYTESLHHVVISTFAKKDALIGLEQRRSLYAYIAGIMANRNCKLFRIGGVENHIHIAFDLNINIALASLVKDVKEASAIRANILFPDFVGWQKGFAYFTLATKDKNVLIEYVKNQELHHKTKSLDDEIKSLTM